MRGRKLAHLRVLVEVVGRVAGDDGRRVGGNAPHLNPVAHGIIGEFLRERGSTDPVGDRTYFRAIVGPGDLVGFVVTIGVEGLLRGSTTVGIDGREGGGAVSRLVVMLIWLQLFQVDGQYFDARLCILFFIWYSLNS